MKQEKPIIEYDPYGHTGNIFWIWIDRNTSVTTEYFGIQEFW